MAAVGLWIGVYTYCPSGGVQKEEAWCAACCVQVKFNIERAIGFDGIGIDGNGRPKGDVC